MAHRAHILLPEDLIREIDALVGPRGRSAFLVETARNEVRKQRLLAFLDSKEAVWHDNEHPELSEGTEQWVRKLRTESDALRALTKSRRRGRPGKTS
jgi:hypothetical protein